jgi:hypothetical protein
VCRERAVGSGEASAREGVGSSRGSARGESGHERGGERARWCGEQQRERDQESSRGSTQASREQHRERPSVEGRAGESDQALTSENKHATKERASGKVSAWCEQRERWPLAVVLVTGALPDHRQISSGSLGGSESRFRVVGLVWAILQPVLARSPNSHEIF